MLCLKLSGHSENSLGDIVHWLALLSCVSHVDFAQKQQIQFPAIPELISLRFYYNVPNNIFPCRRPA